MDFYAKFDSLFTSKAAKLLVMLAFAGLAVSLYPAYNGLYNDAGDKIDLINKWNGMGHYEKVDSTTVGVVYRQLVDELTGDSGKIESTIAVLAKQKGESNNWTLLFKFLAGGALYFMTYVLMTIFFLAAGYRKTRSRGVLYQDMWQYSFVLVIWLAMSLVNMAIPFVSVSVNYCLVPSFLTLVVAAVSVLWKEVDVLRPTRKANCEEII